MTCARHSQDVFEPTPRRSNSFVRRHSRTGTGALALAALIAGVSLLSLHGASSLDETRLTLEKWVQARQSLSQAKAKWETDKELINQTTQLYERELKSVDEHMSNLSTNSVQVEKERAQAEASIKESEAALEQARQFAVDFESQIKKLLPRLPAPLRDDILKGLLDKLPPDPAKTDLTITLRLQTLVAILNEIDKFNNAVTIFPEKRQNAKGEETAVESVYLGLGAAYFVNDANDFAGTGTPGANGWDWTIQTDIAPQVREVIRIYRNERTARFVALPAVIR